MQGRLKTVGCIVQAYTSLRESPGIIAAELAGVSGAGFQGNENSSNAEFRVRASVASREASAMLCIEDNATLEMTIKLPASWPLRPADVECKRKVLGLPLAHDFCFGLLCRICMGKHAAGYRDRSSRALSARDAL